MLKSLGSLRSQRRSVKSQFSSRYRWVTHAAILILQKNINVQLDMLLHSIEYSISIDTTGQIFKGLFTWSKKVFMERRRCANKLAREMLLTEDSNQLDFYKLHCDLRHILKFINLLFDTLYLIISNVKFNIDDQLWRPLRDLQDLIKSEENIDHLIKDPATIMLMFYRNVIPPISYLEHKHKRRYMYCINNMRVFNNVELRYSLSWHDAKVVQAEIKTENNLNELKATIQRQKMFAFMEEDCGDSIVEVIYNNAEKYRDMLERFEYDFQQKNDVWSEIVKIKRTAHEKVLHQVNFYREQSAWYEEEMQRIEAMIQNGQAERQAYFEQQEALREQAAQIEKVHSLKKYRLKRLRKSRANLSHASYFSGVTYLPSEHSRIRVERSQSSKSIVQSKHDYSDLMEVSKTNLNDYKPLVRIQEVVSEYQRLSDISHLTEDDAPHERITKKRSKYKKSSQKSIAKQRSSVIHGGSSEDFQRKVSLHRKPSLHKKASVSHKGSIHQKSTLHMKSSMHHKMATRKRKSKGYSNEDHFEDSLLSLDSQGSTHETNYMTESKETLHEGDSILDGTNYKDNENIEG